MGFSVIPKTPPGGHFMYCLRTRRKALLAIIRQRKLPLKEKLVTPNRPHQSVPVHLLLVDLVTPTLLYM